MPLHEEELTAYRYGNTHVYNIIYRTYVQVIYGASEPQKIVYRKLTWECNLSYYM